MNQAAQQHVERSRKYLTQATEEFVHSDYEQASEKGWGAASPMLKAVAAERGWEHGQHRHLYTIVTRVAEELKDDEVRSQFALASALHRNFYEGYMKSEDVQFHLGKVSLLVEQVEILLDNGA